MSTASQPKLTRSRPRKRLAGVLVIAALLAACGDDPAIDDDPGTDFGDLAADSPALDIDVGDASPTDTSDSSDPTEPIDVADSSDADVFSEELVEPGPTPPDPPRITDERLAQLRAELDVVLADESVAGRDLSALVIEAESGRLLYESDPDVALVPASNTKLFTTATALVLLGPDHRFVTRVFADSQPDGTGLIGGDLYVVSVHDFTHSSDFYSNARFPFDRLADQIYDLGVREVGGTIFRLFGELVYDGHRFGDYDAGAHREAGVAAFRNALVDRGIEVGSTAVDPRFDPPADSVLLTVWESVPLSVACSPLNRISHNEYADILMRHLGFEERGQSSAADGTLVVSEWLSDSGIDVDGFTLSDGSGLSYANRVSARHVVALFRLMDGLPEGRVWRGTLSVGGVRGTLSGRLTGADTRGRVFGKTGTLNITIATSGLLVNRHDGRRYLFSFLMNNYVNRSATRAVQDRAIEALAVDLLDAGPRPGPPELQQVLNTGNGRSALAIWDAVDADGYFVWRSADGYVWWRDDALYSEDAQLEVEPLGPDDRVHVRVTAVSDAGESDPSDVYAVRLSEGAAPLLLVDGQERWQREPVIENTLGGTHDFVVRDSLAIAETAFDSASNRAVAAAEVDLDGYIAVIWSVGEDSVDDDSFNGEEQALVAAYAESGGQLFVSGAEIGWDLVEMGTAGDAAFFGDTLRAAYVGDDAETFYFAGSGGVFEGWPMMGFLTPDDIVVSFPDQLAPANGSVSVLEYVGGAGGTAGLQYDGDYRLVLLPFPFESIDSAGDRAAVMAAVLAFFDL